MPDVRTREGTEEAGGHALAVRRMFDRITPTYDLLNRLMSLGIDRRWRGAALRALFRDLPGGPLLDLCTGTADLAVALRRRGPERTLVAVDFSRPMLLAGRAKGLCTGLAQADAQRLPLASGSFAGAVCAFGIRNLAEPRAGLAELARVLCPGGVLVVLEFFRPVRAWSHLFHLVYGQLVLPAVGSMLSGDPVAYRYLARSMRGFMSVDEFAEAMRHAGFGSVQYRDLTLGVASLVVGVK